MADGITVKLEGIDELKKALDNAASTIRKKAVPAALRKAGALIRDEAKRTAPVLAVPRKGKYPRASGTVRKAISVRTSKQSRREGNEGVFVSVKPLKAAQKRQAKQSGASQSPNDPFYWWWVEFGHRIVPRRSKKNTGSIAKRRRQATGAVPGQFFMTKAAQSKGQAAIDEFMRQVVPQIEKLNNKASK